MSMSRVKRLILLPAIAGFCLATGVSTASAQTCGDELCEPPEDAGTCPQDCPDYLKHDPPPDANKAAPASDLTCWLATTANMLAGAGYGSTTTEQLRAEEIYEELKGEFGALD